MKSQPYPTKQGRMHLLVGVTSSGLNGDRGALSTSDESVVLRGNKFIE